MALMRRCVPLLVQCVKNNPIVTQGQNIHRWVAPTLMILKRREKKQGGKITYPRNTYLEWNLESELFAFSKRVKEEFDQDLLLQAFTDRSYVIQEELKQKELEIEVKMKDNRKLAEEGEKFLNEYIQLYLEAALPKFPLEGVLAVTRHLTSENVLSNVCLQLGTKDIILAAKYPVDNTILATAFKAIVGALIQTSGVDQAAPFVRDFVITQLQGQDVNEYWHIEDPWTMLADILKKDGFEAEPRLIGEVGKSTVLACYRVGLYVNKTLISTGFGEKASIAKEMAAREALKKMFGTEDNMKPITFRMQGIPKRAANRQQTTAS